jgi:hypothetical protein
MCQATDDSYPHKVPMGGISCLDRRRSHFFYYRASISGESPAQFLNDKEKEKELAEEMKKTYGTERGPHIIIIKHISDITTRLATKLMV